jgi:hypothetical protein
MFHPNPRVSERDKKLPGFAAAGTTAARLMEGVRALILPKAHRFCPVALGYGDTGSDFPGRRQKPNGVVNDVRLLKW